MPDYETTRIWSETLRKLRVISALNGESMVQLLDRLATAELARFKPEIEDLLDTMPQPDKEPKDA